MASGSITSWKIDREKMETGTDFIFLDSKITANSDSNLEILFLGRNTMTNIESMLKSRDIILPTKARLVKVVAFPVVMYKCEIQALRKAEHQRTDYFEMRCYR